MENVIISIINFGTVNQGNFLVKIIYSLVSATSSVALGVILFTLILKAVTLPFDFISRSSMRKNSLKMEKMRPELEKLQKQYADNKDLYNQKMMALYKKNGYSMFGACLPTIITLVIFIIAINSFTSYSKFQNLDYFADMSVSYNNVIYSGMDVDGDYIKRDEKGTLIIDDERLFGLSETEISVKNADNEEFVIYVEKSPEKYSITTTNSFVKYTRYLAEGKPVGTIGYEVIPSKITETNPLASSENNFLKDNMGRAYSDSKTETENERKEKYENAKKDVETAQSEYENASNRKKDSARINLEDKEYLLGRAKEESEYSEAFFLRTIASDKAAEKFRNNGSKFLWVKNIWVTDSPLKNPVEKSFESFKQLYGYNDEKMVVGSTMGKDGYDSLIYRLDAEQSTANGYFIFVLLTAGISLLTQLVMGKSQKAQMELQTVDGQGARQQKMMMWLMPIMMAVFSFIYTTAFSIYILISSVFSILTTFAINFIIDAKFKRAEQNKEKEVSHGRVYIPKEEPKKESEKKNSKKKKEEETPDFLSGLADKKKHPRGRIK